MKSVKSQNASTEASAASLAEQASALFDGEVSVEHARSLVRSSLRDDALMQQWRSMSVVGDALRQGQSQSSGASAPFAPTPMAIAISAQTREAANEGVFRWKMLAGIAAVAAVGTLVWGLIGQQAGPSGPVLALSPSGSQPTVIQGSSGSAATAAQDQTLVMIRDPRLDELLAAHRQFGGMSVLQQPAGSLRSASLSSNRP